MRKLTSVLIVIILLLISGCSNKKTINHNYTYKGENQLCTAEYKVNGKSIFTENNGKSNYESNANKILTISFKKDLSELSSVKHLEISFKSSAGEGCLKDSLNANFPIKKEYTLKSTSNGGAIELKDETIKVTVNLDGNAETIELKNVH